MKVRILDNGKVRHNGEDLETFEVYDLNDDDAQKLIDSKAAAPIDAEHPANSEPAPKGRKTPKFDADKKGYVGEAVLTPEEKARLEAEGKLNDATPVTGNTEADRTPEPSTTTVVTDENGKELTEDEIRAREAAAAAVAPSDTPNAAEANAAPEVK